MVDQKMDVNSLWRKMQDFQSGLEGKLTGLQDILSSGNIMAAGDDGLSRVLGGRNRYGEIRPDTVLMRDASGQLDPRFRMSMGPEFQALQQKAMAQGDTEAARLAREQQGMMAQGARDQLQQQGASALTGGMRNLAMRGGAGQGSRERLNRDIARGMMSGGQNINRQNRMANLAISQKDEQMKNQLLGQVGGVGQKIQEGNIQRLQQDIRDQNLAAHNMYGEDMKAYAAEKSSQAQAAAACFLPNTQFIMANGESKALKEIRIGEELYEGGKVTFKCEALSDDVYHYDDKVLVAGSHAVKENGEWIRVSDSSKANKIEGTWIVQNLGTENHLMLTQSIVFSDFFETDLYEELTIDESLEELNARMD